MDACDPGVNVRNLKRLVKQNTGLELDLTREQICDAYSSIQDGKLPLPPMVLSKDGKYMLDRKSPLTGNDFEILFGSDSTVSQLKRVARKAGLASYKDMTKAEMVEAIESTLESKNIREPIRLHVSAQRAVRKVSVNNNNNYPNNLNVNNVNGNGVRNNTKRVSNNNNNNLGKIANESKNLNRNGNRNGETRNENRNGETRNGNRSGNTETRNRNGNRNARPPVNRTTARYVNAMLRRPNSRRNEDLAKVLAAARTTGNGSTQNLGRVIEALRKKPSTDGSTASMLNKLMRAKTSGNSDALRRAMKEIEILKRRGPVASVNDKQQKLAELEKYAIKKGSDLRGKYRNEFSEAVRKHIKNYKNGEYVTLNMPKKEISAAHRRIEALQFGTLKVQNGINEVENRVKSINNNAIRSRANDLLQEFKKNGSDSTRRKIYDLQNLDRQLRNRQSTVEKLFKNRQPLNVVRDEVLNTKNYNAISGLLTNLDKQIEEKKREIKFDDFIAKDIYKNIQTKIKNAGLRTKYMNNKTMTLNTVRGALSRMLEGTKPNANANVTKPNAKVNTSNAKVNTSNANAKGNNEPYFSLNNIFADKLNTLNSMEPQMKNQGTQLGEKLIDNKKRELEKQKRRILTNEKKIQKELQKERQRLLKIGEELKKIGNNQTAEKSKFQNKKFKIERRAHVLETQLKSTKDKLKRVEENLRVTRNKLDNSNEVMAGVTGNLENKIANLKNKLGNSKLTANERNALKKERNALKKERNNLEQKRSRNIENMNKMREDLGNMKTTINTKNRNIEKLRNELAKSASPAVKNKLQANLNQALKNQFQTQKEYQVLTKKLQNIKNLSNGEKRALQEQLNNAMKNRANVNNRLRKSEAEKMQYMREMNTLAGNVRNITKQKENANSKIAAKNKEINQIKKNMAAASTAEKEILQKKLNNALGFKSQLEMARGQLTRERAEKNKKIRSLEYNAATARRERNNLKQKRNVNLKNMNVMREQLGNLKVNRNALEAESQRRKNALNDAAAKEAEITKKLGESNASIKNLTEQRAKLLEKGELNATEKAKLEQIRNKLTEERTAKNNEIKRLKTLSNQREKTLTEISTKLNVATRTLARREGLISIQEKSIAANKKNLKARQNQVGELFREKKGLEELIASLKTQATQTNAQIQQQTTNLATSASEINRLQKQLTNATAARTRNIQNMQMRHAENVRVATAQIQALTKNVQERNAIIQRSKVTGQWKGAAVRGLDTQLRNTRTNLTRAQKEIGVARTAVNGLRGQRNALGAQLRTTQNNLQTALTNVGAKQSQIMGQQSQIGALQARNKVSRGVISGLQGQRKNLQKSKAAGAWKGATRALRANTRLRNAKGAAMRLGKNLRNTRTNLNRAQNTLKFEQKLRGEGAVREQAFKSQRNNTRSKLNIENLRKTLYNRLNRSFINKFKHRNLINRVKKAQSMGEMKFLEKQVNAKGIPHTNQRPAQPTQTREQVTFGGFAASGRTGLNTTTEKTGNRRSRTSQQ